MSGDGKMTWQGTISFNALIKNYIKLQSGVVSAVKKLASSPCKATPVRFLLMQFQMSQVTQVGQTLSNIISQVMTVINNSIRNQKGQ